MATSLKRPRSARDLHCAKSTSPRPRLLLAAGARLDVHWVRRPRSSRKHTHMCGHSVRSCVRQYTMTPLDYARWRNRTALAALLEAEATAQGLTNATRSDEPN